MYIGDYNLARVWNISVALREYARFKSDDITSGYIFLWLTSRGWALWMLFWFLMRILGGASLSSSHRALLRDMASYETVFYCWCVAKLCLVCYIYGRDNGGPR